MPKRDMTGNQAMDLADNMQTLQDQLGFLIHDIRQKALASADSHRRRLIREGEMTGSEIANSAERQEFAFSFAREHHQLINAVELLEPVLTPWTAARARHAPRGRS